MTEAQVVSFKNAQGLTLTGTLHTPAERRADRPAVVLYSPGVKMRVGPGRLYVPLTELLTRHGHEVLRFDFYGLGDSEGDLAETHLADVYNYIEVGRFTDDAMTALQWMKERGHRRFIVGGLCGGAITALYAAQRDPSVEALLSIGMTVTLASDAARPAEHMSSEELKHRRRGYLKRVFNPVSWWRLITLQSELGVIVRSMFAGVGPKAKAAPIPEGSTLTAEQLGNVNPMFPEAYFSFLERGGRALMLFSEKDRLFAEYREKFVALYEKRLQRHERQVVEHLVPGANHVVSRPEWRKDLLTVTDQWLTGLGRG